MWPPAGGVAGFGGRGWLLAGGDGCGFGFVVFFVLCVCVCVRVCVLVWVPPPASPPCLVVVAGFVRVRVRRVVLGVSRLGCVGVVVGLGWGVGVCVSNACVCDGGLFGWVWGLGLTRWPGVRVGLSYRTGSRTGDNRSPRFLVSATQGGFPNGYQRLNLH